MHNIIKFAFKWIIPIGIVELIVKYNNNLFIKDSIGNGIYNRISDAKDPLKGAGILIRIK